MTHSMIVIFAALTIVMTCPKLQAEEVQKQQDSFMANTQMTEEEMNNVKSHLEYTPSKKSSSNNNQN